MALAPQESKAERMKDGIIDLGTPRAEMLGFTKNRFMPFSYLWKDGKYIIISFIESVVEGKGYLSELFRTIKSRGYGIKVQTPLNSMISIIKKKGFQQTVHHDPQMGAIDVWVLEPNDCRGE